MALPFVVGGGLKILGLRKDLLQGDLAFSGIMESIGMHLKQETDGWTIQFTRKPDSRPLSFCFEKFSDTFLTLAAIAPLLDCPVRIEGIGHTRFQETDRIAAMSKGLKRAGAEVVEEETALTIQPFSRRLDEKLQPVAIETFKDHRVAMSFAILGCHARVPSGKPWLHVLDPGCCSKTFPAFFHELEKLYRFSHDSK